jgi:hypothetical protein
MEYYLNVIFVILLIIGIILLGGLVFDIFYQNGLIYSIFPPIIRGI